MSKATDLAMHWRAAYRDEVAAKLICLGARQIDARKAANLAVAKKQAEIERRLK